MKRRSVLPTIIEKCGFDAYSMAELLEPKITQSNPEGGGVQLNNMSIRYPHLILKEPFVIFDHWLPRIFIPGKSSSRGRNRSPIELSFTLRYREEEIYIATTLTFSLMVTTQSI